MSASPPAEPGEAAREPSDGGCGMLLVTKGGRMLSFILSKVYAATIPATPTVPTAVPSVSLPGGAGGAGASGFPTFNPTIPGGSYQNITDAVDHLFEIAVLIAGVMFLVLFLVGGIQYLTSAGNEEASGKAKKLLVDAIIGIIIVLAAWAAGSWILQLLGLKT